MRVGWRSTSHLRREANSEYLRRTSSPYDIYELQLQCIADCTYSCINSVCNISPTTFQVLPRVCNEDGRARVFIEPLLYSTIVTSPLGRDPLFFGRDFVVVVDIAHVSMRAVMRGSMVRGRRLDRRGRCRAVRYWKITRLAARLYASPAMETLHAPGEPRPPATSEELE